VLKNLRFRTKLAAVVLPPVLISLILGTAVVRPRLADASRASQAADRARLAEQVMEYVDGIEFERTYTARFLGAGGRDGGEDRIARRADTDQAFSAVETLLRSASSGVIDERRAADLLASVNSLDAVREGADRTDARLGDTLVGYDALADRVLDHIVALVSAADDGELDSLGSAAIDYLYAKEFLTRRIALLAAQIRLGQGSIDDVAKVAAYQLAQSNAIDAFAARATPELIDSYEDAISADVFRRVDNYSQQFVDRVRQGEPITIDADAFWASAADAQIGFDGTEDLAFRSYRETAASHRDSATTSAALYAALTAVAVAGALAVATLLGRSLVRRLQSIAGQADDIASRQLPTVLESLRNPSEEIAAALPVVHKDAEDEIGSMADSFNTVLRASVETSIEHSRRRALTVTNMLINLGRRNQGLLDRQLELMDHLESSQQDPEVLDGLFKLDHLLTRMRRNAENLLVLAADQPVRGWAEPVPLVDVLRGAASETGDLDRVNVEFSPGADTEVAGRHAVDLSHLVAELVENATAYSPPTTQVVVRVDRNRSEHRLWIVDSGVGMSEAELADANHRISDPPDIDELTADRVGFQVIGRLARRLGVGVRLQENPRGGVAASVILPAHIFASADDLAAGGAGAAASAAERDQQPDFDLTGGDEFTDGFIDDLPDEDIDADRGVPLRVGADDDEPIDLRDGGDGLAPSEGRPFGAYDPTALADEDETPSAATAAQESADDADSEAPTRAEGHSDGLPTRNGRGARTGRAPTSKGRTATPNGRNRRARAVAPERASKADVGDKPAAPKEPVIDLTEDGLARRTPGRSFGANSVAAAVDEGAFRRLPVPGTDGNSAPADRFAALSKLQRAVEDTRSLPDEGDDDSSEASDARDDRAERGAR